MVWRSPESKEGPYTSEKNGWSVCQRFEKSFLGPQKIAQVYQWPGALCKYYEGEKCEGVAKVEYDSCGRGRWSADPRVLVEVFLRKGGIQFGSFTCGRKGKGPGKGPEGE